MKHEIPINQILKPGETRPVLEQYKHHGYYDNREQYAVTKQILESKRPNIGEIELTLFENCNIVCDFCFHDKQSTVGMTHKEMMQKLSIIEQFLKDREGTVQTMQINVVGGELFQDNFMEDMLPIYFNLFKEIRYLYDKYNYNMNVVWVSNFLFAKKHLVEQLLLDLNKIGVPSSLICSYDLSGRPMSNRYYENITFFHKFISSINIVATADTIDQFMKGDRSYFDFLYDNFEIFIDDFIPDKGADDLIPSDKQLYNFYVFMAENYPKVNPIKDLLNNQHNTMHCLSLNKITIFPDNSTSNCRWHRYDQDDFNTKLDYNDNAGMMQAFMDENQCLSCEYFNRCGFRCYTQWDWSKRKKELNTCMMKKFFNYITEKKE